MALSLNATRNVKARWKKSHIKNYSCDFFSYTRVDIIVKRWKIITKAKDSFRRAILTGLYFVGYRKIDVLVRKVKSSLRESRGTRGIIPEIEEDLLSRLANKTADILLTVDIAGRATGVFRRRGSGSKSGRPRSRHGNKQLLKALLRARHTHALAGVECRTHPVIRVGWAPVFH